MNKVLTGVLMSVALTTSVVAQADSEQGQQLNQCKQQLAAIYGEDTRVRISGKAAGSDSTLNFRVYPSGERLQRVSCARTADGAVSLMDRYGIALLVPEQEGEKLSAL
jgi:hypothetical protein